MSRGRGGGGGRGGGRGGFGGRGGLFGGSMPPMGLTFADLQTLSREPTAMYPDMDPLPVLTEFDDDERRSCQSQNDLIHRLRRSKYYIVEEEKRTDLPRYSDKYRPTAAAQPKLVPSDLNKEFFPPELWEMFFNPKKKPKKMKPKRAKKLDINDLGIEDDDEKKDGSDEDEEGKKNEDDEEVDDYEDEEEDDYNENYFETGSQDDADDIGGGGEDIGGGGGGADLD